jgi:hypothetical protein
VQIVDAFKQEPKRDADANRSTWCVFQHTKDAARKPYASKPKFPSCISCRPSQTVEEQDTWSTRRPNWASRDAHGGGRGPF